MEDVEPVRLDRAVAPAADREVHRLGAGVAHREHALAPRLRPAHRPARVTCEPGDEDVLGRQRLGAEAAADVAGDHAHLGRLQPERLRDPVAVGVRRLRREPDLESTVLADDRGRRARLERGRRHPLADDAAADDGLAAREDVLVGTVRVVPADVRPDLREEQHVAAERILRIDDDRERVVVDQHELGSVDSGGGAVGEHDRDDLAREACDVARDRQPGHARLDPGEVGRERLEVDIGAGEDARALDHARVDAEDARVRQRRADEDDVQRSLELEVLDVSRLAHEEARILLAQDAPADKTRHALTSTTAALLTTEPAAEAAIRDRPARR